MRQLPIDVISKSDNQTMKMEWFYVLTLLLSSLTLVSVQDVGFDVFFSTNLQEMEDVAINFTHPLPRWLRGTLIRNGLGRFELGERTFLHSFDAFGKLSSWKFPGNGSSFFSTKLLQSNFYKDSVKSGDIAPYLMFEGVTPDFNEAEKLTALARGIDNMNVNIYSIYNERAQKYDYLALNDFWKVYEIQPSNLSTIRPLTPPIPEGHKSGSLGFLSFLSSAHPLPEYGTSNHFTYVSSVSIVPGIRSKISLVRLISASERELVAQWSVDKVPYMHSFSITEHYAIFFASPFYVNTLKMIRYAEPIDSLDWNDEEDTTIYVIELATGKVTTLKTDNVFTMHHVNAFEADGGTIVVDISSYPSPDFVRNLEIKVLRDKVRRNMFDAHALLKRYEIDLESESIQSMLFEPSEAVPFSAKIDMPTINEHYRQKPYCYVYGIVLKKDNINLGKIAMAKKNLCGNRSEDDFWFKENHYPVEGWFVSRPGSVTEDDGVLLVPVLDGEKGTSYLAILDAKNMTMINQAYLPTAIPFSLHGRFFPELY